MGGCRRHVVALGGPLLWVLLSVGCVTGPDVNYGPFFNRETTAAGRTEVKWPFLLSAHTSDPAGQLSETRVLWPLFLHREEGPATTNMVFPFFWEREFVHESGIVDYDVAVLPGFFYGHSLEEGSYFAILPFGGLLKGIWGKDLAVPILFPLYAYLTDKGNVSHHILWPLINFQYGDGKEGWRFWPLVGHYTREEQGGQPISDRWFGLWPFFTYQRNNLNMGDGQGTTVLHVFPFYGHIDGPNIDRWTVLYPFFKYSENHEAEWWELRAPFPFVILARGKGVERTDLWPFFGWKERQSGAPPFDDYRAYERMFILEPFYRYERMETARDFDVKRWFMPFYWSFYREWRTGREDDYEHEWKIWPLVRYHHARDGAVTINALSPLWFKDPPGFEAIYNPLTRIYRYERAADGSSRTEILYGLYQEAEDPEADSYDMSFLYGMVQLSREQGRTVLKLFWLFEIELDDELQPEPVDDTP